MSSRILPRLTVIGLTLSLGLLPLASARAAQRDRDTKEMIGIQMQQLGLNLLRSIGHLLLHERGLCDETPAPPPGQSDGAGIDPHGGSPTRP